MPLFSGNGLSVLSKRNAQRSRFGTSTGGYVDSVGIVGGALQAAHLELGLAPQGSIE